MEPCRIYNFLKTYKNCESDMCSLKSVCTEYHSCSSKSTTKVIDFDVIKNEYCKQHAIQPNWKSVDGVCAKKDNSLFLFVEKKSWTQFFLNQKDSSDINIVDQSLKFGLEEKYEKSVTICENIIGQGNIFTNDNHAFIFFTDIPSNANSIEVLNYKLNLLGLTASYVSNEKIIQAQNASKIQMEKVVCSKRFYKFCRNFDKFINEESVNQTVSSSVV